MAEIQPTITPAAAAAPAPAPTPEAPPDRPATPEAPDREAVALSRLEAGEPPQIVRATLDRPADDAGKPAAAPGTEAETKPATPAEPKAPSADESAREALVHARSALRRDGWGDDDLTGLPEATILKIGAAARKRQTDVDRLLSTRTAGEKPEGTPDEPEQPDATSTPTKPKDDALDAVVAYLKDMGEDELAAQVAGAQGATSTELETARQQLANAQAQLFQNALSSARAAVSEDYPQLRSDEVMIGELGDTIARLADSGTDFASVDDLVRAAALVKYGPAGGKQRIQAEMLRRNHEQRMGQPLPPTDNGQRAPAGDPEAEALAKLDQGMDPAQVRSEFRQTLAAR